MTKTFALGTLCLSLAVACGAPEATEDPPPSVQALLGARGVQQIRATDLVTLPPAQSDVLAARLVGGGGGSRAEIECWTDPWRVICTNRTIGVTCTVEHGGTNPECHNENGD